MPKALIPSFILYCYITGVTPGPANLCSLSAGIRYGKTVALRQWRGLFVGFFIDSMLAVVTVYFLGTVLNQYVSVLSFIGAAYILWMAWHMLIPSKEGAEEKKNIPSFKTGILVQLTNVKVMVSCITALASFVLPYHSSFLGLLAVGLFLPLTGPLANLLWLFAGASLQQLFQNHKRTVDTVMAISLVLCAISIVWPY